MMKTNKQDLTAVVVTDCGSTTTKALLFQNTPHGWRQTGRGEAPTTVEEPVADVTIGAVNAFFELQEVSGRTILRPESLGGEAPPFVATSADPETGVDLYLSTSSAGGGLQMLVGGVVRHMTAESAERAALGAGAIVMDVVCADDGREDFERIERIRHVRPDIVLLCGGVDGGSRTHVVELAELLRAASPRPRFGETLRLPVIYAGNADAADEVCSILSPMAQVSVVPNVRPRLDEENLVPAREAIHEFFLSHVMSHSPGYGKLLRWTPVPIEPTPSAVGKMVRQYARRQRFQVLCVDIGGATTDVFSVFHDREDTEVFNRTVSANLGMSYSVANVLVEAGASSIARWLPYQLSDSEVRDRLRNKMIRPTSIPQTRDDLWLEQAVCREALRLSLEHHRALAVGLSGRQQRRGVADIFSQQANRYDLVDLMQLDVVIGSGGVLSHAPHRLSAALMMLDGFALEGVTKVTVDSIFMMPHLGVFSSVHPEAAEEIFLADCLIHICHTVVPVFPKRSYRGKAVAKVFVDGMWVMDIIQGKVQRCAVPAGKRMRLKVEPLSREINAGAGPGRIVEQEIVSGSHGLVTDGRNRPIEWPESDADRISFHRSLYREFELT